MPSVWFSLHANKFVIVNKNSPITTYIAEITKLPRGIAFIIDSYSLPVYPIFLDSEPTIEKLGVPTCLCKELHLNSYRQQGRSIRAFTEGKTYAEIIQSKLTFNERSSISISSNVFYQYRAGQPVRFARNKKRKYIQ